MGKYSQAQRNEFRRQTAATGMENQLQQQKQRIETFQPRVAMPRLLAVHTAAAIHSTVESEAKRVKIQKLLQSNRIEEIPNIVGKQKTSSEYQQAAMTKRGLINNLNHYQSRV